MTSAGHGTRTRQPIAPLLRKHPRRRLDLAECMAGGLVTAVCAFVVHRLHYSGSTVASLAIFVATSIGGTIVANVMSRLRHCWRRHRRKPHAIHREWVNGQWQYLGTAGRPRLSSFMVEIALMAVVAAGVGWVALPYV